MTKDELTNLVKHANSAWNQAPYAEELKLQCRTWFHFLHDLSFDDCIKVIDNYAVTGRTFLPKPGEIRQRVIVGKVPTAMEAWAELQSAREAVYAGRMATPVSHLTLQVTKRLGDQAKGMHTNGDRDKFEAIFQSVVAEWLEAKCATTPHSVKWPCVTCGGEGVKNIGTSGYCWYHLRELVLSFEHIDLDQGFGIPISGAEDHSGAVLYLLECAVCEASWYGSPLEACWWCQQHLERLYRYQREVVMQPPEYELSDQRRANALRAWAERLENAVKQEIITEGEAKNALARELRRTE